MYLSYISDLYLSYFFFQTAQPELSLRCSHFYSPELAQVNRNDFGAGLVKSDFLENNCNVFTTLFCSVAETVPDLTSLC